jgi:hypothetical protein
MTALNQREAHVEIEAAVAQLRSKDHGTLYVVESLARQLPRESFLKAREKLERRRRSTSDPLVDDAAYFVSVLKIEVRKQRLIAAEPQGASAAAAPAPEGLVDRVKREDPQRYVQAMAALPGFDLEGYLAGYVDDEVERERLRGIAA